MIKNINQNFINSIPKSDDEFKNKLNKIFNINDNIKTLINISENIKWSNWITANQYMKYLY